jgi:hypothetical protein
MTTRRGFLKALLAVAAAPMAVARVLADPTISVRRIIGPFRDEIGRGYFIKVQPLPRVHSQIFFLNYRLHRKHMVGLYGTTTGRERCDGR